MPVWLVALLILIFAYMSMKASIRGIRNGLEKDLAEMNFWTGFFIRALPVSSLILGTLYLLGLWIG